MTRQKLLLKNKSFFFHALLIWGLLHGGPSLLYAQGPEESAATPEAQMQEEHDTKDLEKLLKNYNTDSAKIIDDTSKIHNTDALESEVSDSEIESMQPSVAIENASHHFSNPKRAKEKEAVITGQSLSENIRIPLASLQKLSEKDLLKLLKENTRDSKFAPYVDQFPKLTLFSVRLIKDKEAIPSVVKIIEDQQQLIWFAGTMLSTFILGFILERIMRKEGRSILGSIGLYMLRVLMLTIVRFALLMYFYKAELTPAMKVFDRTFF